MNINKELHDEIMQVNKKIKNEDKEKVVIPVKRKNKNSDFIAN